MSHEDEILGATRRKETMEEKPDQPKPQNIPGPLHQEVAVTLTINELAHILDWGATFRYLGLSDEPDDLVDVVYAKINAAAGSAVEVGDVMGQIAAGVTEALSERASEIVSGASPKGAASPAQQVVDATIDLMAKEPDVPWLVWPGHDFPIFDAEDHLFAEGPMVCLRRPGIDVLTCHYTAFTPRIGSSDASELAD